MSYTLEGVEANDWRPFVGPDVEPEVVRRGRHRSRGAGGMRETWGNFVGGSFVI